MAESQLGNPDFEVPHPRREMGMSRRHLFRKSNVLTSASPGLLIRTIRLHKAAELLMNQDLTMA